MNYREPFKQSALFRASLGQEFSEDILASNAVVRLRVSLDEMRERVGALVQSIPQDCKGLTVHDVTHMDALWDTASLVAGQSYDINPAEAFVLGAAILVHDAGLTAAAFKGGMDELRSHPTYRDLDALYERSMGSPSNRAEHVLFATLRTLHGQQARTVVEQSWPNPSDGSSMYLLDNQELRSNYARSIGDVAASHHWSVDRLNDLRSQVGAASFMPTSWVVDERKLAAILRIADIVQIDRRRAPSMHYALQQPIGQSDLHWRFQNKFAKPSIQDGQVLYNSGQAFALEESESWWLGFETIAQVDDEIRATNKLLARLGLPELVAKGAYGAKNLTEFSKQVGTVGWNPVDASIKVSNPRHLASLIGGTQLYGAGLQAPIREMLQNSVDAIRARRALENRDQTWGAVSVSIEEVEEDLVVTISDNGVGMSEDVLCGALIDFGKSLWSSEAVAGQFPGLAALRPRIIGKYGIGFFSLFGVASTIEVISCRYDASRASAKKLSFSGINTRPVLTAAIGELGPDESTRITFRSSRRRVVVPKNPKPIPNIKLAQVMTDMGLDPFEEEKEKDGIAHLVDYLDDLIVPLNVMVSISATNHPDRIHRDSIVTGDAAQFFSTLVENYDQRDQGIRSLDQRLLMPLLTSDNQTVGRAALDISRCVRDERYNGYQPHLKISVGGFSASPGGREGVAAFDLYYVDHQSTVDFLPPMIGVVEGDHKDVSRHTANPLVSRAETQIWLDDQIKIIQQSHLPQRVLAQISSVLVGSGYRPRTLPFSMEAKGVISFDQWLSNVKELGFVDLLIEHVGDKGWLLSNPGMILEHLHEGRELEPGVSLLYDIGARERSLSSRSAGLGARVARELPSASELEKGSVGPIIRTLRAHCHETPSASLRTGKIFTEDILYFPNDGHFVRLSLLGSLSK